MGLVITGLVRDCFLSCTCAVCACLNIILYKVGFNVLDLLSYHFGQYFEEYADFNPLVIKKKKKRNYLWHEAAVDI